MMINNERCVFSGQWKYTDSSIRYLTKQSSYEAATITFTRY